MNSIKINLSKTNTSIKFNTFLSIVRFTLVGSILWAGLFIAVGYYIEATFPSTFFIILGTSYYLREKVITNKQLTVIYTTLIFILPISLQIIMGGIYESGFVGIWAVLSPISALLFLRYTHAKRLFILFISTIILIIAYEAFILKDGEFNTYSINTFLLAANIIAINIISFLTFSFFTGQILKSKKEIHTKTKTLNNGLDYAKTVQTSIINSNLKNLEEHLNFFLYCKPKEVVCGDFLWSNTSKDNIIHLAVADCAGNGVSAAFLSILGSTYLEEIILTNKITDPAEILIKLSEHLQEKQRININKSQNFLMDMAILKIDLNQSTIEYSTANSLILKYSNNELQTIESDSASLGSSSTNSYSTKKLLVSKGDKIYLSSNGLINQPDRTGKKLGKQGYYNLINDIASSTIVTQEIQFNNKLNSLTADKQLMDDILVVGIRI